MDFLSVAFYMYAALSHLRNPNTESPTVLLSPSISNGLGGTRCVEFHVDMGGTFGDMTLYVQHGDGGLTSVWKYDRMSSGTGWKKVRFTVRVEDGPYKVKRHIILIL